GRRPLGVHRGQLPGLRGGQEEAAGRGRCAPTPAALQAAAALTARRSKRAMVCSPVVSEANPGNFLSAAPGIAALSPGYDSLSFRIALTCAGLALPLVAAITFPTSALKAFSLPPRSAATVGALAGSPSSTIFSIAPASEICLSPRAPMIASASPSPAHMAPNTSLAILPEITLS